MSDESNVGVGGGSDYVIDGPDLGSVTVKVRESGEVWRFRFFQNGDVQRLAYAYRRVGKCEVNVPLLKVPFKIVDAACSAFGGS